MRLPPIPQKRSSDWVLQLINIVFLLLLFFLVNGTIAGQQELSVEPPRTVLATAANPPGDAIYIDAGGAIRYLGEARTVEGVAALLAGAAETKVVADRRLKATRLVAMLGQMHRLGIGNVALITVQDTPP